MSTPAWVERVNAARTKVAEARAQLGHELGGGSVTDLLADNFDWPLHDCHNIALALRREERQALMNAPLEGEHIPATPVMHESPPCAGHTRPLNENVVADSDEQVRYWPDGTAVKYADAADASEHRLRMQESGITHLDYLGDNEPPEDGTLDEDWDPDDDGFDQDDEEFEQDDDGREI